MGTDRQFLSRTCSFGQCMVCGTEVTERANEHFMLIGGQEVYVGATHTTCDITPEQIEKGYEQNNQTSCDKAFWDCTNRTCTTHSA